MTAAKCDRWYSNKISDDMARRNHLEGGEWRAGRQKKRI